MSLLSLAIKYDTISKIFGEELVFYCLELLYCDITCRGKISLNRLIATLHITYEENMENIVKSLEGIYDGHKYCSYLENILDTWINDKYFVPAYS